MEVRVLSGAFASTPHGGRSRFPRGTLRAIATDSAARLASGSGDQNEVPALAVTMLLEAPDDVAPVEALD